MEPFPLSSDSRVAAIVNCRGKNKAAPEALPKGYVLQQKEVLLDSVPFASSGPWWPSAEEGALWNPLLLTWERRNFSS